MVARNRFRLDDMCMTPSHHHLGVPPTSHISLPGAYDDEHASGWESDLISHC